MVADHKDTIYENKKLLDTQRKEFDLIKFEFETTKVRMSTDFENKKFELGKEIELLTKANEIERDKLKEREMEIDRCLNRLREHDREVVSKEADIVDLKSQLNDFRKDILTNEKQISIQADIEAKLRSDLSKNVNIDFEMKREMDKMLDDISKLTQTLTERDSRVAYLEKELSYNWNRNQRLSKTVDKMKYEDTETRRSWRNSYLPYQSAKMRNTKSTNQIHEDTSPKKSNNTSVYYSNMPNYYSKYVPPNDKM